MRRLLILLPLLLVCASVGARAEDRLDVVWRQATIVRLSKPATSVVIGDPTVADVTLDDPTTVIVFGKAPGETNLIVLNDTRELVYNESVVVSPSNEGHVTILDASAGPAKEILYSCGPERCTRVLSPSDIAFQATSTTTSNSSSDTSKSASSNGEPTIPAAGGQGGGTQQAAPAQSN
jgi:hypothetical protein